MMMSGKQTFNGTEYTKFVIQAKCAPTCRLNVYGSYSAPGFNVNLWTSSLNDTQDWIFEPAPGYKSGYYIIRSANKPSCVLAPAGTSNSSNVQLATYKKGNTNQIGYVG